MTNGEATAFPAATSDLSGLTKREYFAAMVIQGLMANPERYKYVVRKMDLNRMVNDKPWSQEDASQHNAEKAVYLADALIEALNKESK